MQNATTSVVFKPRMAF